MNLNKAVNKGLGIIFFGSNGVGKTSLVSEVGKYALTQGWSVSFFTLQKYISSTYADNDMEVDTNADILIVDELDKAYVSPRSDYTPKVTEELFRNSLNAGRVVLSATNMTEEGLKSMFGPSVMSMVKRKMKFATLPGNDYSVTKQDMWTKDLLEDFNYFHPNILKMVTMKGIKESLKDDNS